MEIQISAYQFMGHWVIVVTGRDRRRDPDAPWVALGSDMIELPPTEISQLRSAAAVTGEAVLDIIYDARNLNF